MPWWAWLLIALYCAPGVWTFVALLTMKPIYLLPEDGDPPFKPRPWWFRALMWPLVLVLVLVLWPVELWAELRPN
jgi:hypothetical protein